MNAEPSGISSDAATRLSLTRRETTPRSSLLACGLVLGGAAATVSLAGGPTQGSLGIFLVCAGLALVFCPPQRRLPWSLWAMAAVLLICGASSFLPESWFGVPTWRRTLETTPAIHLAKSVTPVPWETGFWLGVLGLSLLTGFLLLTHPVRSRTAFLYALVAVIVCGVYAGLAMYASRSGWRYPFAGGATFGFFPNRNHTATLLMTGSLVALGVLAVAPREKRWLEAILAGAGLTLCLAALFFFSPSRGGIVFLLVGAGVWAAGLGRANWSPRLLVSLGVLATAALVLLLISGSAVRDRLISMGPALSASPARAASSAQVHPSPNQAEGATEEVASDFRLLIWRDTRDMIRDFPLTGSGLGTFANEFGHYRRASLTEYAAIHPESDWLMLATESGLPAAVCAAVLVLLLSRRMTGLSAHPFWPLRWALAVAAGAAVLHGTVDVPLHRVALGWWVLALGGLGFQAGSGRRWERSHLQHVLFVVGGVAALALGGQLIRAEWFGAKPLPPFIAERAPQEIVKQFEKQPFEAIHTAERFAHDSPMSASIYHVWGVTLLHFEDSDREVDEAFHAERLLNPVWPEISFRQGDAWAVVDPKRAAALWLDGMERQRRIAQVKGSLTPARQAAMFSSLMDRAQPFPGVTAELAGAAALSPANTLAWINGVDSKTAQEKLGQIVATEGLLAKFDDVGRQQLLLAWDAKGNRDDLAAFLAEHPDWQDAAALLRLRQLVRAGHYEEAVRAGAERYGILLALPTRNDPPSAFSSQGESSNPIPGFIRYWLNGNPVTARRILNEGAANVEGQPWTAEYWRLRTALAAQDQAWPQAWDCLTRTVRAADPKAILP